MTFFAFSQKNNEIQISNNLNLRMQKSIAIKKLKKSLDKSI